MVCFQQLIDFCHCAFLRRSIREVQYGFFFRRIGNLHDACRRFRRVRRRNLPAGKGIDQRRFPGFDFSDDSGMERLLQFGPQYLQVVIQWIQAGESGIAK